MKRRFTFDDAKALVGLTDEFEIRTEAHYRAALALWKERTIAARRANDDSLAAELSRAKEVFRSQFTRMTSRVCPTCGKSKSASASECQLCSRRTRFYPNRVMESTQSNIDENKIEQAPVLIPPRANRVGETMAVVRKLATEGQVGNSFVSGKTPTAVATLCRLVGMQVISRIANPQERDMKKRRWRYWRSDGKSMEEVNEVIRKRQAGEPVPASAPCVPPSAEELAKMKGRRGA